MSDHDEIAVTELGNNRVSVFSSDGTHLRSFGREGKNNGDFDCPKGIAFDGLGNIVVQTVITTGYKSLIGMVTFLVSLVITGLSFLKVYQ